MVGRFRDTVEVKNDSESEPGGDGDVPNPCWWIAVIDSAKGGFYKVKYQVAY